MAASISFNFEWYACLLTLRNYPWRPTYNGNIVLCKILDVNERDTCPTTKHKQVSRKSKVGIFQLYSCKYVQFFLCQELTLLVVWVNVVHGKRISLYLAVVVCCRDDMLQWYGVYPMVDCVSPMTFFKYRQKSRMNSSVSSFMDISLRLY